MTNLNDINFGTLLLSTNERVCPQTQEEEEGGELSCGELLSRLNRHFDPINQ